MRQDGWTPSGASEVVQLRTATSSWLQQTDVTGLAHVLEDLTSEVNCTLPLVTDAGSEKRHGCWMSGKRAGARGEGCEPEKVRNAPSGPETPRDTLDRVAELTVIRYESATTSGGAGTRRRGQEPQSN